MELSWENDQACQVCDSAEYTLVTVVMNGPIRLCICPFCLAILIDRATGWKVWSVMASWENTRRIHKGIKAMRDMQKPENWPIDDESTP
jgi:hypothetical protein